MSEPSKYDTGDLVWDVETDQWVPIVDSNDRSMVVYKDKEEPIKNKINIGYFYFFMMAMSFLTVYQLITGKLSSIAIGFMLISSVSFVVAWFFNLFCTCTWYKDCGRCVD